MGITSYPPSKAYRDEWERLFGKKKKTCHGHTLVHAGDDKWRCDTCGVTYREAEIDGED